MGRTERTTRYRDITDYGIIGNCHSAALVSSEGSIDWLCLPRFDSPSVFGRLLDFDKGGYFQVRMETCQRMSRSYLKDTNILETVFHGTEGEVALLDFMPISLESNDRLSDTLIRVVECRKGNAIVLLECSPSFDYGAQPGKFEAGPNESVIISANQGRLKLYGCKEARLSETRLSARFELRAGERKRIVLETCENSKNDCSGWTDKKVDWSLDCTAEYWRSWSSECSYSGRYRDQVVRAALALKLLTYEPTGGIVAAPTTSLPEHIGGKRNWDYRYTWLRDASLTVHALYALGHYDYADRFVSWICKVAQADAQSLQVMYGLHGERDLTERTLDHLEGYKSSRPVRVGNAAVKQHQLDVYGDVLMSIDLARHHGRDKESPIWKQLTHLVDWVCDHWREPDHGIWEVRTDPRHFVYSNAMAWVAIDRGMTAARELELPADFDRWQLERDKIKRHVLEHGWSDRSKSFVQFYGSEALDAANLRLSQIGFIEASHPKMTSTIEQTMKRLMKNKLVFRYRGADDGIEGDEATFSACTLWLVQNLSDLGQIAEARDIFESFLERGNDLGLFAEEIDPDSGQQLGNFPQAFTLVALIAAALDLEQAATRHEENALITTMVFPGEL